MQVMAGTGRYLDAEWEPARLPASSPTPVDISHLARYTLGDKRLEREILGLFVAELPRRIEALRAARSEKDWKMATHTLKGSGRAIGAWRLAQLAQEAEQLAILADGAGCAAAIERLAAAAADTEAFIAELEGPAMGAQTRRSA